MEFFLQAQRWIERSDASLAAGLALVTVVETRGSVPRHVGARMLVDDEGKACATIGGGRVEAEVTSLAARIARGDEPSQVVQHHLVRDLAMCCGGSMTLAIEKVADGSLFEEISTLLARRSSVKLTCRVGGGVRSEPATRRDVPSWDGETFVETLWPRERAVVFGAGHVARALVPLLSSVDFEVVVCDDNELGALEEIEGDVDQVIASFEPFDVDRAIGPLGATDFALVVTRDHAIDQRLVEKLLVNDELGYVGLIGSLGKVGRFKRRVLDKGVVSQAQWQRLSAPIGVDIGAETPAEIAVSIAAELVARRVALRRGER